MSERDTIEKVKDKQGIIAKIQDVYIGAIELLNHMEAVGVLHTCQVLVLLKGGTIARVGDRSGTNGRVDLCNKGIRVDL